MRWWLAALALVVAAPAAAETLTNANVVALVQAGVGESAVIAKIKATPVRFQLDTADVIDLRQRGVPSDVITAMIAAAQWSGAGDAADNAADNDPLHPHPPGMYLRSGSVEAPTMVRMTPTIAGQTRSSGILGYTLTGGFVPLTMKSVVAGPHASVRAGAEPLFYFYAELSASGSAAESARAAISLVRFAVKPTQREARVGSFTISGTKTGVAAKDRIQVDWREVAPGVFRVQPRAALVQGEYGFLTTTRAGSGIGLLAAGGITTRVFDFAVGEPSGSAFTAK